MEDNRGKGPVPVGDFRVMNIDPISRCADVAWDVFSRFRGLGIGYQLVKEGAALCWEKLNLRRLNTEILATNEASSKCAESAGFIKEGVKKEAVFKVNRYIDSTCYGLINSEVKLLT